MQVNCWISGEAGERMKALAKAQNISYGQLLTALLLNQPVAVKDWQTAVSELIGRVSEMEASLSLLQSLQGGDELRGMIADQDVRLNRIETAILSGLGGRDAMVRVTVSAAEIETVGAEIEGSSHPADHSFPTAQEAKIQYERQLDERIVDLKNKGLGIKKIQAELGIGQKRVYKGLGAAGLKE